MQGKIILIEGVDCSGKQTQSELLVKHLNKRGIKAVRLSFPMYDTPTGRIIAGPYLGKPDYGEGVFKEGASNVEPKVASLYYCADRMYNIEKINTKLQEGYIVVLDRYVESNMAHQSAKFKTIEKQQEMINWIEKLEYEFLNFPKPNKVIFLHLPTNFIQKLKQSRDEKADQHEQDEEYLKNVEQTYLYLAKKYNFNVIECLKKDKIRDIEDIGNEILLNIEAMLKE